MVKRYDVIKVGAGAAGIFAAYELVKERPDLSILVQEKGRDMYKQKCPKHSNGILIAREIIKNRIAK